MAIERWKTAAMFRPYAIVDGSDLDAATRRVEEYQKTLEESQQQTPKLQPSDSEFGYTLSILDNNQGRLPKRDPLN